jgi:hypothetical protein
MEVKSEVGAEPWPEILFPASHICGNNVT